MDRGKNIKKWRRSVEGKSAPSLSSFDIMYAKSIFVYNITIFVFYGLNVSGVSSVSPGRPC